MNIQKSISSFNKNLVFIEHDSFSASFELNSNNTNVLEACQGVIAKEVAKQTHDLVNEGKMGLFTAARAGLSVVKQIENEAEVHVFKPNTDALKAYTEALISMVASFNTIYPIEEFEKKYGSLPKEIKEYIKNFLSK